MNRLTVKKQRRVLRGWIKWVPVVAIPFSILFFHAWLNVQIIRADYVLRSLDGEAREWTERLNDTGMAQTYHEDPNLLAEQAEQMAFIQPSPWQRESVPYHPIAPIAPPEDNVFTLAQADGAVLQDPAATESRADQGKQAPAPAAAQPAPPAAETAPTAQPGLVPFEAPTPATDGFGEMTPMASTPVALQLDASAAGAPAEPVAPAPAAPAVVLDLPEEAYVEDLVSLESDMESLESL